MPSSSPLPTQRLSGRTALVTGGARGQGAAHVERLAAEGAVVYLADVLEDAGTAEAERLRSAGLDVTFVHLDVADEDSWAAVASRLGDGVDILVNNAGILHTAPLDEESLDAWRQLLDVNLTGMFLGIRTIAPLMPSGGSIINISSIFGRAGAAGFGAYTTSKFGIIGLTRVAALELAERGIRVNVICPGGVATPMADPNRGSPIIDATPLQRYAQATEIAAVVAFLASDDSSYMTGAEVPVDGGYLAR